jgi:SAM-dependent methyltransferase
LGRALLLSESRIVEEAFDGIFGEQCLQLGLWGKSNTFLRHARTQRSLLIDEAAGDGGPSVIGQLHRLPVASDSVDCVLLPHVLDYSDRPHAILREVDRVLTAHGHLAILGFKTGGLWGSKQAAFGAFAGWCPVPGCRRTPVP